MRKSIFVIAASLMLSGIPVTAQKETPLVGFVKETGARVSLAQRPAMSHAKIFR